LELPETIGVFVEAEADDRDGVEIGGSFIVGDEELVKGGVSGFFEATSGPSATLL